MTTRRHTETTVCHWDLDFAKQFAISADPLLLNRSWCIVGHDVAIGGCGASHRKRRQCRYHDSKNYPPNAHDGLPDIRPLRLAKDRLAPP